MTRRFTNDRRSARTHPTEADQALAEATAVEVIARLDLLHEDGESAVTALQVAMDNGVITVEELLSVFAAVLSDGTPCRE